MTPGAYRRGGRGVHIRFTIVDTALGSVLVAATDRGLCSVTIGAGASVLEAALRREFPAAELERADADLRAWAGSVVARLAGDEAERLPLDVSGTPFQWQVWEALQRIPRGATKSYAELARDIGRPTAARAVARACASNKLAVVIPCHRVVREDGDEGGYRWGVARKRELLKAEREKTRADGR